MCGGNKNENHHHHRYHHDRACSFFIVNTKKMIKKKTRNMIGDKPQCYTFEAPPTNEFKMYKTKYDAHQGIIFLVLIRHIALLSPSCYYRVLNMQKKKKKNLKKKC